MINTRNDACHWSGAARGHWCETVAAAQCSLTLRFGCVLWKVGGVKTKVSVFPSPQNLKTRYSASLVQNQWQETKLITYYDFTASCDRKKESDEATQKLGHSLWLSHSKWLLWALMEAATYAGCAPWLQPPASHNLPAHMCQPTHPTQSSFLPYHPLCLW
jgi:hypothetical protein